MWIFKLFLSKPGFTVSKAQRLTNYHFASTLLTLNWVVETKKTVCGYQITLRGVTVSWITAGCTLCNFFFFWHLDLGEVGFLQHELY